MIGVVYGHGGEQVPQALRADDVVFVKQHPQLGTGHAVKQALPHLSKSNATLVLYGDVPLISAATLCQLSGFDHSRLTKLTANLEDPHGYGRIVRDAQGAITGIVEEKDATDEQRDIREINTGIMMLPGKQLETGLTNYPTRIHKASTTSPTSSRSPSRMA